MRVMIGAKEVGEVLEKWCRKSFQTEQDSQSYRLSETVQERDLGVVVMQSNLSECHLSVLKLQRKAMKILGRPVIRRHTAVQEYG